jgi:hypothetical protein
MELMLWARPIPRIRTRPPLKPANSSGRVRLDRRQELEIDLNGFSVDGAEEICWTRGWPGEATELHKKWVEEGGRTRDVHPR